MVKIKQQLVSKSVESKRTYGGTNQKRYITVHQTGNTGRGANAQMHANLQSRLNPRQASWHIQVDDKEAIQSFPYDAQAWHAGDGRGNGNLHSIGVEICINSDGNYLKALENGAKVVKYLMDKFNIPLSNVKRHYDWDGKYCPAQIMSGKDGVNWSKFKDMVQNGTKAETTKVKPVSDKSIEQLAKEVIRGSHGTGEERKANLGSKYNAVQKKVNELLGAKPVKEKSIDELAQEVIDGKHGSGEARKKALGANYSKVQARVNEMLAYNARPKVKPLSVIAQEVIDGKHGNGEARRNSLTKAGYNPDTVQKEVNRLLSKGSGILGNSKNFGVGSKVTVPAGKLYGTSSSNTAVNNANRVGYVEHYNPNWKNPYRLVHTKGKKDWLGFYRP